MNKELLKTTDEVLATKFIVRAYTKVELAELYSPDAKGDAAVRLLNRWIRRMPNLKKELKALGATMSTRIYNPAQVKLISKYLGEP